MCTDAAGGDHDVVADVVRGAWLGQVDAALVEEAPSAVEAPQVAGEPFAHVAEDEGGAGETVEDAAEDDAQGVGGGLQAPAPHRPDQFLVAAQTVPHVVGAGRAQVDRHAEGLGALPHRPEPVRVQVLAVRVTVDQGTSQAELGDGSFQLGRGAFRVLQGQCGEAGEAGRVSAGDLGEEVVGLGGPFDRHGGVGLGLDTGGGQGQHLHVDAELVHLGQPDVGEVQQPPHGGIPLGRVEQSCGGQAVVGEGGGGEVLFDRDLLHGGGSPE